MTWFVDTEKGDRKRATCPRCGVEFECSGHCQFHDSCICIDCEEPRELASKEWTKKCAIKLLKQKVIFT